jgi:hypothetical protein
MAKPRPSAGIGNGSVLIPRSASLRAISANALSLCLRPLRTVATTARFALVKGIPHGMPSCKLGRSAASGFLRIDMDMYKIHVSGTCSRRRHGGFENNFVALPATDEGQDVLHDDPRFVKILRAQSGISNLHGRFAGERALSKIRLISSSLASPPSLLEVLFDCGILIVVYDTPIRRVSISRANSAKSSIPLRPSGNSFKNDFHSWTHTNIYHNPHTILLRTRRLRPLCPSHFAMERGLAMIQPGLRSDKSMPSPTQKTSARIGTSYQSNDEQHQDRPDSGGNDLIYGPGADVDAQAREQPTPDKRADDSNSDVTDDTKAPAGYQLPSHPTCDEAHHQYDDQTFA